MNNSFKTLSWNICWGCMLENNASRRDGTAYKLAYTVCAKNKKCKENIINYLNNFNSDEYYFIGLQEATNWKEIYDKFNSSNKSYGYIQCKQKDEEIVTFYNKDFFQLIAVKNCNISNKLDDGRPGQIMLFKPRQQGNDTTYIVINLHAGHRMNKEQISKLLLDQSFITHYINTYSENFENLENDHNINSNYLLTDMNNNFNIIVMGDFNDHGTHNAWEGFKPFEFLQDGINNILKETIVSAINQSNTPPPYTCCAPTQAPNSNIRKNKGDDYLYGDYILINQTLDNIIELNIPDDFIYDATSHPTSDHLPIIGNITFNGIHSSSILLQPTHVLPELPISEIKKFKLQNKYGTKTLRMINDLTDPNISNSLTNFKGETINKDDTLIFPGGKIISDDDHKFVFIITNDNQNIGYIQTKYLKNIQINNGCVIPQAYEINKTVTLRLKPFNDDPNKNKDRNVNYKIKGSTLRADSLVYIPNGEVMEDTGLVVVQVEDDPEKIGFVQGKYLEQKSDPDNYKSGGNNMYFKKYLKYKNKYHLLKNKYANK